MDFRTYDDWKLASPYDEDNDEQTRGECDCCGKRRALKLSWSAGGMEAYACAECRGLGE